MAEGRMGLVRALLERLHPRHALSRSGGAAKDDIEAQRQGHRGEVKQRIADFVRKEIVFFFYRQDYRIIA